MINGELIVDNFAGGTGESKSARIMQGGEIADMPAGPDAAGRKWTDEICVR